MRTTIEIEIEISRLRLSFKAGMKRQRLSRAYAAIAALATAALALTNSLASANITLTRSLTVLLTLLVTQPACASAWKAGALYSGDRLTETKLVDVVASIPAGGIVIVSEQHDFKPHHENQISFLNAMGASGAQSISVGMEFFSWPEQSVVDQYLQGALTEADFLKQVGWGGNDFSQYREQVLFPHIHAGQTLALNAPRTLTGRISKVGLSGLSSAEMALLPQGFTLGNVNYFERFKETMAGHVPEAAILRYFEAQSVWDETMASRALEFLQQNPTQRLMIIVGDFHAIYGGGLPDRLRARGAKSVQVISQVNLNGLTDGEENDAIASHPKWGPRAEFVWISR